MTSVITRWQSIIARIQALQAQTPDAPRTTLIAVSKTQPAEAMAPLLEAGQRDFGENRVSEALAKWPELKRRYPDIRLHLIGSLQTNKAKDALALFDVIHTVDRESLVDALTKARGEERGARGQQFFIQVNTGEESQKGGVLPEELPGLMRYILAPRPSPLASLPVTGLMCIPPAGEPPAPHFALLKKMAGEQGLVHLSMGMSGDYETGVRLGATYVRVGTALFGERPSPRLA